MRLRNGGNRRDLVLALIAPVLLVVVALVQVYRVQTIDQSSWSGAGFGMFATIDNETYRLVRGYQIGADGEERVAIPPELQRQAFELRVVPTEERARALAERWRELNGDTEAGFAVEVWSVQFDPDGPRLTANTLRRVVVR